LESLDGEDGALSRRWLRGSHGQLTSRFDGA
jgi:hypothetical protein